MPDQAAPYKIKQRGDKWVVLNNMGEVKGEHDSREEAVNHLRALYVNVKKAPETADRKKFTGRQKRPIKVTNTETPLQKIIRLSGH